MKKIKVIINYASLSQSKFIAKTNYIVSSMKDNTNFTDLADDVADLEKDAEAYTQALANPTSKANTALKRALRTSIAAKLKSLGMNVEVIAENNEEILISSGFDLKRPASRVGILPAGKNLRVFILGGCRLKISVDKIKGAYSYNFEFTTAPASAGSVWTRIESTSASLIVGNLTEGALYAFRVSGIGSNPNRVYTNIITSYAV